MLTELITPANVRAALERAGQAVGFNQLGAIISIDGDLVSIAFTTSSARREQDHPGRRPGQPGACRSDPRRSKHGEKTVSTAKKPVPKVPRLVRVKSSSVSEIGHTDGHLFVRFAAGSLYSYPGVTADQFKAVQTAKSVGRALQAEILAKHKGTLVQEPDGA
jgi:hypothetical protein